jgi:uncharacterized protein YjbI with pentapeptide repeats
MEGSEGPAKWEEEAAATETIEHDRDKAIEALFVGQIDVFNIWRVRHPELRIDLRNANLEGHSLANAMLFRCDLDGANLRKSDLRRAMMAETSASLADFGAANLSEARMSSVNFTAANFRGAILHDSRLMLCRFNGAVLQSANLSGMVCDLPCDFRRANLDGTNIDTELSEITRLSLQGILPNQT